MPRWAKRLASVLLTAAAVVFVGAEIVRNLEELRRYDWAVRPGLLLLSTLLLIAVFLWGVLIWQVVLRRFGVETEYRALARTWFWANISRYIPGMVWQFVSLAHLSGAAGLRPAVAVSSLLVQIGFALLSAILLSVYLLPLAEYGLSTELVRAVRWAAPALILATHPSVLRTSLRALETLIRRPIAAWNGTFADGVGVLGLATVSWALYGVCFFLFLNSVHELPAGVLPAVTAMNALAFLVGYVAFFAPGGLGFKEGALAVLLSTLMPRPVAFSLAVAARLWTIVAEVVPAVFLIRRSPRGRRTPTGSAS